MNMSVIEPPLAEKMGSLNHSYVQANLIMPLLAIEILLPRQLLYEIAAATWWMKLCPFACHWNRFLIEPEELS